MKPNLSQEGSANTSDSVQTTVAMTGMLWGLKDSFLKYIERAIGSRREIGLGAGVAGTGEFFFELADDSSFDRATMLGLLRFQGVVRLWAHHGMLDVLVRDPWVTVHRESALLSIADPTQAAGTCARLDLVSLELPQPTSDGETLMWSSVPARLEPAGVPFFNYVYEEGTPFEPVTLRILH